jgi:hypothetical protein
LNSFSRLPAIYHEIGAPEQEFSTRAAAVRIEASGGGGAGGNTRNIVLVLGSNNVFNVNTAIGSNNVFNLNTFFF